MTISHTTGKIYRGINQLLLSMAMLDNGYSSKEFITFNQAKKQGEKSRRVANHTRLSTGKSLIL